MQNISVAVMFVHRAKRLIRDQIGITLNIKMMKSHLASIRKNPPAPEPERDVCLHLSARPSEQQPGPVSDVHGLVPLAALPHQHWHHVLHVRVVPGRGRRWARGWRWGRRGGWGGEPGHPDGEPRTVAAGRGEESRGSCGDLTSFKYIRNTLNRISFMQEFSQEPKEHNYSVAVEEQDSEVTLTRWCLCHSLFIVTFVYLSNAFFFCFREMMSQKRTAPPHLMEKVTMVTIPPFSSLISHLPLNLKLSGHVMSYYWHIMYTVVAHMSNDNPFKLRGNKCQTLSSRWGNPFQNAWNLGWDHHSMRTHTACVYQNPGQLWKHWTGFQLINQNLIRTLVLAVDPSHILQPVSPCWWIYFNDTINSRFQLISVPNVLLHTRLLARICMICTLT